MGFTILMDMDGVIYPFEDAFNELMVQYGGEPVDFTEWQDFSTMPGDIIAQIWADPSLFSRVEPYPAAIETLVALKQLTDDLYLVTRPGRNPEITIPSKIRWVQQYMPWFDIRYFTTMFPKWLFRADMIVDDHPPIVDKWRKQNEEDGMAVLLSRPWNEDKQKWLKRRGAEIAKDYVDVIDLAYLWAEELQERGIYDGPQSRRYQEGSGAAVSGT